MTAANRCLAKSLHTITVLVNVAEYLMAHHAGLQPAKAMRDALDLLQLQDKPDLYGLADIALDQIKARRAAARKEA